MPNSSFNFSLLMLVKTVTAKTVGLLLPRVFAVLFAVIYILIRVIVVNNIAYTSGYNYINNIHYICLLRKLISNE